MPCSTCNMPRVDWTRASSKPNSLWNLTLFPVTPTGYIADGFGLSDGLPKSAKVMANDHQGRSPVTPEPREPRPEDAISPAETKLTATGSTLQDQELMAEGKHFSLQGEARAETITH